MPAETTGTSGRPAAARCQQRQQEHEGRQPQQDASRDNRNIRDVSRSKMPAETTGTSGTPAAARCQQRLQEHQRRLQKDAQTARMIADEGMGHIDKFGRNYKSLQGM
jgi:hypothetical protein